MKRHLRARCPFLRHQRRAENFARHTPLDARHAGSSSPTRRTRTGSECCHSCAGGTPVPSPDALPVHTPAVSSRGRAARRGEDEPRRASPAGQGFAKAAHGEHGKQLAPCLRHPDLDTGAHAHAQRRALAAPGSGRAHASASARRSREAQPARLVASACRTLRQQPRFRFHPRRPRRRVTRRSDARLGTVGSAQRTGRDAAQA